MRARTEHLKKQRDIILAQRKKARDSAAATHAKRSREWELGAAAGDWRAPSRGLLKRRADGGRAARAPLRGARLLDEGLAPRRGCDDPRAAAPDRATYEEDRPRAHKSAAPRGGRTRPWHVRVPRLDCIPLL